MELAVTSTKGSKTSKKVKLSDDVFAIEANEHAVYLDVKQHLANKRQGTHKAKERGEITGSTKKIKKQKGTGTARAGSLKNPLFKGGGRVFGPRPRTYGFKLNKKVKQLARKSALTAKAQAENLIILEDFKLDAPKTKEFAAILENIKASEGRSLLVLKEENKNIYLSSRNLQGVNVVTASELNTYEIVKAKTLILSESSVEDIDKILG